MRHIALLGSTGSIGKNALKVIQAHADRLRLVGVAAGDNLELLSRQIRDFDPPLVSVKTRQSAEKIKAQFPSKDILHGSAGLEAMVSDPRVDTVIAAISGTDPLRAILAAIRGRRRLCLANKETVVAAGKLLMAEVERSQAELLPLDSEQCAIFQCLENRDRNFVRKVILTASGGPFFRRHPDSFATITPSEALAHPTWSMGGKITIDSATLVNKAFEMIEAFHLFRLRSDQIDVLIHPQSVVHSLVEFVDASLIAQLSRTDMRIPILYSLSYPERIDGGMPPLDLAGLKNLEFFPVDAVRFPAVELARRVLTTGDNAGAVFEAANEVAVSCFMKRKISFRRIVAVVDHMLAQTVAFPIDSVEDVEQTVECTRRETAAYIEKGVKQWQD